MYFIEEAQRIRALRDAQQFEEAVRRENALLDDLGYQSYLLSRSARGQMALDVPEDAAPEMSELARVFGAPSSVFSSLEELAAVEEEVRRTLGILYVEENSDGRRVVVYRPRVDDFMQMMQLRAGASLHAAYWAQGANEWEVAVLLVYEDAIQFAWRQGAQYWSFLVDDERIGDGCHLIYVENGSVKCGWDAPLFTFGRAHGQIASATLISKRNPAAAIRYEDGSWHVFHVGMGAAGKLVTFSWHFTQLTQTEIVGAKALAEDE